MNREEINQENFDYLSKQIAYSGFSMVDPRELEKKMQADKNEFSLDVYTMVGKDKLDVQLNFGKADNPKPGREDLYFFNSYDVKLLKEGAEIAENQTFKVSYGNSYTLREAYNMMQGRSVNKDFIQVNWDNRDEDKTMNAWAYINFKQPKEDGKGYEIRKAFNFDLEKTLKQLPIKDLEIPAVKHTIMDNLKKGNYQKVKFIVDGKEEGRFIEAAARYNSINVYDENMNRQYLVAPKEQVQANGQKVEQGQGQQMPEGQTEKQPDQNKEQGQKMPEGQTEKQSKKEENNLKAKQEPIAAAKKPGKKRGAKIH